MAAFYLVVPFGTGRQATATPNRYMRGTVSRNMKTFLMEKNDTKTKKNEHNWQVDKNEACDG